MVWCWGMSEGGEGSRLPCLFQYVKDRLGFQGYFNALIRNEWNSTVKYFTIIILTHFILLENMKMKLNFGKKCIHTWYIWCFLRRETVNFRLSIEKWITWITRGHQRKGGEYYSGNVFFKSNIKRPRHVFAVIPRLKRNEHQRRNSKPHTLTQREVAALW